MVLCINVVGYYARLVCIFMCNWTFLMEVLDIKVEGHSMFFQTISDMRWFSIMKHAKITHLQSEQKQNCWGTHLFLVFITLCLKWPHFRLYKCYNLHDTILWTNNYHRQVCLSGFVLSNPMCNRKSSRRIHQTLVCSRKFVPEYDTYMVRWQFHLFCTLFIF